MEVSCLDSHAGTITRLRNRQLEGGKKVMFPCRSLFRSQRHIIAAYAEGQAIFHHKLLVHGISVFMLTGSVDALDVNRSGLWAYKKLDSIGRKGVIHPDDLEKAEIETEPPPRRRLSILAVSEASGSVRGQIKKFFTWKGKVLIKSADAPPPYQDF